MIPTTLASYGGPHVDAETATDPQGQLPASTFDRMAEDVAQMTRTVTKARVWFDASAVAAPFDYAAADVNHESIWGSGSAQKPTVRKTANGRYTITYAATFTDTLGVVEAVNFRTCNVTCYTATAADVIQGAPLTVAANVATIKLDSPHGTLADAGNTSAAALKVCVELS